jgi:hypothetical protein
VISAQPSGKKTSNHWLLNIGIQDYGNNYKPANIPTKYWLTPSGVKTPTSENTSEIRSGLSEMVVKQDVKKGKASQT